MKKDYVLQATKSFFLGGIATCVDFILYSILHYAVFKKLANIPFNFGPFNYSVQDGGLCNFISMAISYLVGQTVNYFVQRKFAFNAKVKTTKRTFRFYILSVCIVYLVVLYIPGLIGAPIHSIFGLAFGPIVTKAIATFIGFLIQFPINKYLIFKN